MIDTECYMKKLRGDPDNTRLGNVRYPARTGVMFVKIHGPMRSSTNYLHWTIQRNFVSAVPLSLILGWKHGPFRLDSAALDPTYWEDPRIVRRLIKQGGRLPPLLESAEAKFLAAKNAFESGDLRYVVIAKHPVDWMISCRRVGPTFLGHGTDPQTLADKWSEMYRDWIDQLPARGAIVKWEDLLARPQRTLAQLAELLHIDRAAGIHLPDTVVHPGAGEEQLFDYERFGRQRLGRLWPLRQRVRWCYKRIERIAFAFKQPLGRSADSVSSQDLEILSETLSRDVMSEFGYSMEGANRHFEN